MLHPTGDGAGLAFASKKQVLITVSIGVVAGKNGYGTGAAGTGISGIK